jgi:hypothetical protein
VAVVGNAGFSADAIAEFVLALLFAPYKRIIQYSEKKKSGDYRRVVAIPLLSCRIVAVLGLGEIGTRVARALAALGLVCGASRGPQRGALALHQQPQGGSARRFLRRLRVAVNEIYKSVSGVWAFGVNAVRRRVCKRRRRRWWTEKAS